MILLKKLISLILIILLLVHSYFNCKLSTQICYHKIISEKTHCQHHDTKNISCCKIHEFTIYLIKKFEFHVVSITLVRKNFISSRTILHFFHELRFDALFKENSNKIFIKTLSLLI